MSAISCLLLLAAAAPSLAWAASTDCRCAPAAAPVCGSDGATYDSKCALDCARAGKHSGLSAVHEGPCGANSIATAAVRDASSALACLNGCVEVANKCGGSCYTSDCSLACFNTAAACGCACASLVSSGRAAGPDRAVAGPALEALATNVTSMAARRNNGSHLLGDAADDVAACINSRIASMRPCIGSCSTTSCLDGCVSNGLTGVCSCPKTLTTPPTTPSTTTTQSPTDAIGAFVACQSNCAGEGNSCVTSSCGGLDNSCSADCMRTTARCTCGCTEALKNATSGVSLEGARAPLLSGGRTNRTSLLRTLTAPPSLRGAGNDMLTCINNALERYKHCPSECKDVACRVKCARDVGEQACRCGAAGLGRPLLLVLVVSALAWAFK